MTTALKIVTGVFGVAGASGVTYFGIREFAKEDLTPHLVSSKLEKGILNTKGDDTLWTTRDNELGSHSNPVDEELKAIKEITSPVSERKGKLIKWCEWRYKDDSRKLKSGIFEEIKKFCTSKISEKIKGKSAITDAPSSGVPATSLNWGNSWNTLKGDAVSESSLTGDFKKARIEHSSKSGTEGQDSLKAACEKYKSFPYLNENDLIFKNVSDYCYTVN